MKTSRPALPPLGLGTAPLGNLYSEIPERQAVETIEVAIEQGAALIDTAPWYGRGLAERRVGLAVRGVDRTRFTLSSKVGRMIDQDGQAFDFSRDGLERSLEGSLKRLGVDQLDIVYLHDPDNHERDIIDLALPVLECWRKEGTVARIGVGMNQWQMLHRLAELRVFDTFMLAGRYTLLDRTGLPMIDRCLETGTEVVLAGVFNSGILATGAKATAKYNYVDADDDVRSKVGAIENLCAAYDTSIAAAAIGIARSHAAVSSVVLGAASPAEVRANFSTFQKPPCAAFWQALEEID